MKLKEEQIYIFGISLFLMIAGVNVIFDGEQFTSFEYTILYMITAMMMLLLLILTKVNKRKR